MYLEVNKTKRTVLIFFSLLIFGLAMSIFANDNLNGNKNIFLDSDQDGLSDQEELVYGTDPKNSDTDGDGYSDGTEVKSGYDPLKPAPGDKIVNNYKVSEKDSHQQSNLENTADSGAQNSNNKNLTEELSVKLATTISNNNEEGIKSVTMDDINTLVDESISDNITFDDLPKIDKSEIKIKKQKYSKLSKEKRKLKKQKDNEEYLTKISFLMINNLPYKISKPSDVEGFTKEINKKIALLMTANNTPEALAYFDDMGKKGKDALNQLKKIEVPKSLVNLHMKGMQLLTYSIQLSSDTTIDHNDPVKSIFAMGKVQNLLTLINDFTTEVNNEFENLGISLNSINI